MGISPVYGGSAPILVRIPLYSSKIPAFRQNYRYWWYFYVEEALLTRKY